MDKKTTARSFHVDSRVLSIIFVFAIAIAFVIYLFASGNIVYIPLAFVWPRGLWLILGTALVVGSWFLEAFILQYMARKLAHPLRFLSAFRSTMVVQFFNNVTPFASGGQPMQIWSLWRDGTPVGESTSLQLAKFGIFQTVLTFTSALAMVFAFEPLKEHIGAWTMAIAIGFAVHIAVLAFVFMLILRPKAMRVMVYWARRIVAHTRWRERTTPLFEKAETELDRFEIAAGTMTSDARTSLIAAGLTFVQLQMVFMAPFCIMQAMGIHPDFIVSLACASFVLMVSGIIPLPGASGGAEGAFALVFGMYFAGGGPSVMAAALLWRTMTYYLPIIAGAPFCIGAPKQGEAASVLEEGR